MEKLDYTLSFVDLVIVIGPDRYRIDPDKVGEW